jgi:H/ACA ribonucleoprotein complex subunit 4
MELKELKEKKDIKELLEFSIINLDKPKNKTSSEVVLEIMKILSIKRAGHFGTLDPNVTGVLPIALNRACKLNNYFMKKDKEYIGKMRLHKDISKEVLEKEIEKFSGKIKQIPPIRSAVKRVERIRKIKLFKIIKKENKVVEFYCNVEAGTYIRKLIYDLGEKIGGAQLIELRRTKAGIFLEKDSISIEKLKKADEKYKKGDEKELREILIPAEIIKQILTSVNIKGESIKELLNGRPLMKKDVFKTIPNSRLFSVFCKDRFIGVYQRIEDKEDIIALPEFVFN